MIRELIGELEQGWRGALAGFMETQDGIDALDSLDALLQEDDGNYNPEREQIFAAFRETSFDSVRVVIIGQDPYPNPLYATGLAFSTDGCMTDSLNSIYDAIEFDDVEGVRPESGNLERWAEQGVLLLNSALTLRRVSTVNQIDMHMASWNGFIQAVVEVLAGSGRPIHFMLWGNYAHAFECYAEAPLCTVRKAYHPIGEGPNNDMNFHTCRHFSAVNAILTARKRAMQIGEEVRIQGVNYAPIDWFLTPEEARRQ